MLKPAIAACLLILSAGLVHAAVDGVTVFQEDKKFSEAEVTVKRGQTITFTNKDPVTHNVYSKTPSMGFDLRIQKPGQSSEVQFDTVGEADVLCAIHPQMKMKVKVVE
jgi:plastocyanin